MQLAQSGDHTRLVSNQQSHVEICSSTRCAPQEAVNVMLIIFDNTKTSHTTSNTRSSKWKYWKCATANDFFAISDTIIIECISRYTVRTGPDRFDHRKATGEALQASWGRQPSEGSHARSALLHVPTAASLQALRHFRITPRDQNSSAISFDFELERGASAASRRREMLERVCARRRRFCTTRYQAPSTWVIRTRFPFSCTWRALVSRNVPPTGRLPFPVTALLLVCERCNC